MPKWGMVIDLDKCTACQACSVACTAENNVSFVGATEVAADRILQWQRVLAETEGAFPLVRTHFLPRPCMHCEEPPCVQVCPVGATFKRS